MKKKCPKCQLVNFINAEKCGRCSSELVEVATNSSAASAAKPVRIARRVGIFFAVAFLAIFTLYLSLIFSADPLSFEENEKITAAIYVLDQKGFKDEVFLLRKLTSFRANDNWLNASIEKENAYAATNFPFAIMTVYPDFFSMTVDDVERAAILLHEAKHISGNDEREAYSFVWKNREKLGWTEANYAVSPIWRNVRKQTKEYAPELFICELNQFGDCTEDFVYDQS
ncbi:MAG: hypothetical protein KIS76_05435 [Pyrinomonadaceae bacterium]|nr:hypothetical protein [Pyrinomonadaceae bacterium]